MAHSDIIIKRDPNFTITPATKVITTPESKISLVQYDHDSTRFGFQIPRYVDGHDMSICERVEVHYINVGTDKQEQRGVYEVDDIAISAQNTSMVDFSWLVSQNATQHAGSLAFLVRFICYKGGVEPVYVWNTLIFSGITISNGMYNGEVVAEGYADILEQWRKELDADLIAVNVLNTIKGMGALDVVKYIEDKKIQLKAGKMYYFEGSSEDGKIQLKNANGNMYAACTGGLMMLPESGFGKYLSIKEKPSSISTLDLLDFKNLFSKIVQSETFTVASGMYIETADDHNIRCWEIAGNARKLQIGTYATRGLIEGITSELNVSFLYPLNIDEYALSIDGVEIDRQQYGGSIRIASELIRATDTEIVFYQNNAEVVRATLEPTILSCGMLYAKEV